MLDAPLSVPLQSLHANVSDHVSSHFTVTL